MYTRNCRGCGEQFETPSRTVHYCSTECRDCPERQKEARRGYWLKFMYGITSATYDRILKSQDHCCAICYTNEPGGSGIHFHVDHCHETGDVRGLLCSQCNQVLGLMEDNPGLLIQAAEYLGEE